MATENINVMLRDKIIAECNFVITGNENYLGVIRNINDYFLSLITPKNLNGNSKDNIVIQFQVSFGELSAALMSNGISDPEAMTVFKFYSALKFFESKRKHKPNESL